METGPASALTVDLSGGSRAHRDTFVASAGLGANIDQQFLAAGLVDEIRIHLVNVLLGGGRRLFDQLPKRIELEQIGLSQTDGVTHLEYRVLRNARNARSG